MQNYKGQRGRPIAITVLYQKLIINTLYKLGTRFPLRTLFLVNVGAY